MADLHELTPDQCWPLLEGAEFGRIAWAGPAGPAVLPLNYALDGESVWLRTGAHSDLGQEADESPVALLVDSIDPHSHAGWSVLLRGKTRAEYHEENVPEAVRGLVPWASGPRPIWFHLVPDSVTGRRLG